MFQSYTYPSYKDPLTITDSDFQETVNDPNYYWIESFIEVYSRRKLNVAFNLVLCMQYLYKKYGDDWSIDEQISYYKKYLKDFDKYIPDIKKYLSLL